MRLILALALFLFSVINTDASTYWISRSGSDANSCFNSVSKPTVATQARKTFQGGAACLTGGDTLMVEAGIYTEIQGSSSIVGDGAARNVLSGSEIPSGTASAKTTIRCETLAPNTARDKTHPVCEIKPAAGNVYFFKFESSSDNRSYIVIDSFRFNPDTAFATQNSGIRASGSRCDNCEFKNISFVTSLVLTQGGSPIAFSSNTAFCDNAIFEGLWIDGWNHADDGGTSGPHGIYEHCNNAIIRGNRVENMIGLGIQHYSSGNIAFTGGLIENNYVKNSGRRGILVGSTNTGAVIRRNVVNGAGRNSVSGIDGQIGINIQGSSNVVYNNVAYNSTGNGITSAASATVRNNISLTNDAPQISGGTTSNNITSGTAADIFQDLSGDNFCLKSGASTAIDQGLAISGMPFNGSAPDIGACETVPITGLTANAVVGSVDITFPINVANSLPLLPASGITGFTLSDTRTVTSATRLSDSVVRLSYTGTCTGGTFSYSPGNLTTSSAIPSQTQSVFTITNYAITNSCGGSPPDPPAGLHIHYKLDDGSGTNANDETANNLDGTLTGSPTWVTGRTGGAVSFTDEVADYITVPYGSGVNPSTQSLTIAFDFYPTTSGAEEIYFGSSVGTNQRLYISKEANDTLSIAIQSSSASENTEFPISINTWYRTCLVMNSGTDIATLYLNGVAGTTSESVKSYTSYTLASNFDIGRFNGSTATSLPGVIIDNFKLWTSAESCADDYANEWPTGGGTGTFTQVAYQWYLLRKDPAGNAIKLPSSSAAVNSAMSVPTSAVLNVEIQLDCTAANCDPVGSILKYDLNSSGTFLTVSDNCAVDVCFYGISDSDSNILSGIPTCPLSGALTCVDGSTQRTATAIPVVDMAQNNSTVLRYSIKINSAVGTTLRLKLANQNGTDYAAPSQYPTITVVNPYTGGF